MIVNIYIITFLLIFLLIKLGEHISNKYKVDKLFIRKFIHVSISFFWFIQYYYLKGTIHFYLIPLFFTLINIFLIRNNKLSFLAKENSLGFILYPFSLFIMSLYVYKYPFLIFYYGIAFFVMSYSDGLAPLIASLFKTKKIYKDKTISGSLTVLVVSFLIIYIFKYIYVLDLSIINIITLSLIVTVIEMVTGKYDNAFIPLGLFFILMYDYSFINMSLILSVLLTLFASYKDSFNKVALFLAFSLSMLISSINDLLPFYTLVIVYILTISSDKIKRHKKRDSYQVISNILSASLAILIYKLTNNTIFYKMFFVVIGSALADTFASSIGSLSSARPFSIRTFKRVQKGESGGITLLGLLASLLAGLIVGSIYYIKNKDINTLIIITILSLIGSFIDSILGILLEIKYECPKCKMITDKKVHCDTDGKLVKGFEFINNNTVNLLMNIIMFIISYLIFK